VIEPGANIGGISAHLVAAVGPAGLVVSLEPSRLCFAQIMKNNDAVSTPQFQLENAALGRESGSAVFYETDLIVSAGWGYLACEGPPLASAGYEVPTRTVDELMLKFGIGHLRFLKLDIEGSELAALQGARSALDNGCIDFIMVETNFDTANQLDTRRNREISALLTSRGFEAFKLNRSGRMSRFDFDSFIASAEVFRTDLIWARRGAA
jgi:FkbM family methyltransferase